MINTQVVDASIILLSLLTAGLYTYYLFRRKKTPVRKVTLYLVVFAGLWAFLNAITHIIAILVLNAYRLMEGSFGYNFHFYSLLLMGVVMTVLSGLQLLQIERISQGDHNRSRMLTVYCWSLIAVSAPAFPINPLGALPVITSVAILLTMRLTAHQWRPTDQTQEVAAAGR